MLKSEWLERPCGCGCSWLTELSSLRQNKEKLDELREVLFTLWGDLEEKKSEYLKTQSCKKVKATQREAEKGLKTEKSKTPSARPGDDLPPDSDEENGPSDQRAQRLLSKPALSERNVNIGGETRVPNTLSDKQDPESTILSLPVTNKAFTCCIQQYGIKVPEKSSVRADAGDGMRWKRMFGLFGTSII
jgi:protection of telomeres protein 1